MSRFCVLSLPLIARLELSRSAKGLKGAKAVLRLREHLWLNRRIWAKESGFGSFTLHHLRPCDAALVLEPPPSVVCPIPVSSLPR